MPQLVTLRLSNDHTSGTSPGAPTPAAAVADNDLALGRLVEGSADAMAHEGPHHRVAQGLDVVLYGRPNVAQALARHALGDALGQGLLRGPGERQGPFVHRPDGDYAALPPGGTAGTYDSLPCVTLHAAGANQIGRAHV